MPEPTERPHEIDLEHRHGFLSMAQRELAAGEEPDELSESARANRKSQLKKNARGAVRDWRLIAESDEITPADLEEIMHLSEGHELLNLSDSIDEAQPESHADEALAAAEAQASMFAGREIDGFRNIAFTAIGVIKKRWQTDKLKTWDDIISVLGEVTARVFSKKGADKDQTIRELRKAVPRFIDAVEKHWPDDT